MPKIVDLTGDDVWLDLSTATSVPEFIRALRKSVEQNEEPVRGYLFDVANYLEKLWKQIGGK